MSVEDAIQAKNWPAALGAFAKLENPKLFGSLYTVIRKGASAEVVREFSRLGAPLEQRDHLGNTALQRVLEEGDLEPIALALIDAGARCHIFDAKGRSMLHLNFDRFSEALALKLLEHGARVDGRGETASNVLPLLLPFSASNEKAAWFDLLVRSGANLNLGMQREGDHWIAIESDKLSSPIRQALLTGNFDAANQLLESGAILDFSCVDGPTLMSLVSENRSAIEWLKDAGISVDVRNLRMQSPLLYLLDDLSTPMRNQKSREGVIQCACNLLQAGADLNAEDDQGAHVTPRSFIELNVATPDWQPLVRLARAIDAKQEADRCLVSLASSPTLL